MQVLIRRRAANFHQLQSGRTHAERRVSTFDPSATKSTFMMIYHKALTVAHATDTTGLAFEVRNGVTAADAGH